MKLSDLYYLASLIFLASVLPKKANWIFFTLFATLNAYMVYIGK